VTSLLESASMRRRAARDTAEVLGCRIDRLDMEATVRRCQELIDAGEPTQHVAINAAKLVMLSDDARLREIVAACGVVNADGQAVVWASKLLGDPLPTRVAGIDLMHRLLDLAEDKGYRVFILGARQEVLERALEKLRELHPRLEIAGARHGYFRDAESAEVCAEIRARRAHILFVAMSSPRKEYWLAEHGPALGVPFLMGVGGSIDVLAGVTRRAPGWMQQADLEWLYRFLQEPRRLAKRYATTNARFLHLLVSELATRRRQHAGRAGESPR
jgi:N-acetylglucosaminyldiphosphoundecaprenol N-acetyl-beta-D-mannosaminyltransferase